METKSSSTEKYYQEKINEMQFRLQLLEDENKKITNQYLKMLKRVD